jgi:hypothetical protein
MRNKFSPNPKAPNYSPIAPIPKKKRWVSEDRKRQLREQIQRTKPWLKSTGPRSFLGKKISSQNAIKHGIYVKFGGKSLWAGEAGPLVVDSERV